MQKKMLFFIMLFACCFMVNSLQAQRTCGHTEYMNQLMQNPDFAIKLAKQKEEAYKNASQKASVPCTNPLIIPVAVHYAGVVTGANPTCLIDAAQAQIDQMNLDFSSCNSNAGDLCSWIDAGCTNFGGTEGADAMPEDGACIQFCLGDQNLPAGEDNIGGLAITVGDYTWASATGTWAGFMNVFVSDGTTAGQGPNGLGIAPLFGASNPNGNGVWVVHTSFGSQTFTPCTSGATIGNGAPFNGGATLTHEVGHYFGLEHTFESNLDDIPPQTTANGGCPTVDLANCTSSVGSDYSGNFMDYVEDDCMHNFSADQVTIMQGATTQGVWATNSISCFTDWQSGTNTYASCNAGPCGNVTPTASFTASNNGPIDICSGSTATISFTDTSTGAPTSWSWNFMGAGVSPMTSTAQNPTVTVSAGGTLTAELTATNANGSSAAITQTITINVVANCTSFVPGDGASGTLCTGECITFNDSSIDNPTSWNWSFAPTGDLVLDVTSSTTQNPTVCLTGGTSGTVVATLTTNTGTATNTITITLDANCTAGCAEATNYDVATHSAAAYTYSDGTPGYLSGNNGYADESKADEFDLTNYGICTPSTITGYTLCFTADAGVTGNFSANVWDDNAGEPGTIISNTVLDGAAVETSVAAGNTCIFIDLSSSPVSVTGKFYVGIADLNALSGGYLGLLTNTDGDSPANTGWEQWNDFTWNDYNSVYGLTLSHAIFVEILPSDPVVAINVPTPAGGFCDDGTAYTFSENATLCTAAQGTTESYVWTVSNGQTSTAASANFSFTAAGSYTVELCVTGLACEVNCMTETISVVPCGTSGCPDDYDGANAISGTETGSGGVDGNGDYETDGIITSTQDITSGIVDYDSAAEINMNAGFCVQLGAQFNAFIDGCNGTGGGVNPLIDGTSNRVIQSQKSQVKSCGTKAFGTGSIQLIMKNTPVEVKTLNNTMTRVKK